MDGPKCACRRAARDGCERERLVEGVEVEGAERPPQGSGGATHLVPDDRVAAADAVVPRDHRDDGVGERDEVVGVVDGPLPLQGRPSGRGQARGAAVVCLSKLVAKGAAKRGGQQRRGS